MRDTKSLRAALFAPTTSLSGNESPTVFRGENLLLRGAASGNPYFECFPGNKDLGEDYDLTAFAEVTGTLAFTAGSTTVTGLGSVFTEELRLDQHILAGTQVLQVFEIVDDGTFICRRAPDTTESNLAGYRLPQLFEIDGKRGVQLTGNAIRLAKNHIISVGSGILFINGEELSGTSLEASNRAKAAIYRVATDDYEVQDLGFDDPPPPPFITVVSGGTKGMIEGNKHSFQVSWWTGSPNGTDGYSNPSDPIKLDASDNPIEITATENQFEFDFSDAMTFPPPDNAKGFVVWCSQAGKTQKSIVEGGGSVTDLSPNQGNYENGPWLRYKTDISFDDLDVNNKFTFDYLDKDLIEESADDNFRPPPAEFVCKIEGKPTYISCFGKPTADAPEGSNPGTGVIISKFKNVDGCPYEWTAYVSAKIIGWFEGVGRWFVMTRSSLEFIFSTGLFGQNSFGGATVELPIAPRPYWKTGAANRYSVIIVDDTLFGRSGGRFFKSVGSGDENVKKYDFGSVMDEISRDWNDGYVFAGNDPRNTQIAFIHTAAYKNDDGYWVSEIYPYSLFNDAWLPKMTLSSSTRDMIISGVVTIDEQLEFLCGGRVEGGGIEMKTYRFGAGDDDLTEMPWYLVWQISDDGTENMSKQIHSIRPSGKFTEMHVQVHGAKPGQIISIANMENGDNATDGQAYFSGNIPFGNTAKPTRYLERRVSLKNLAVYALRISGTWNGSGIKDRLEELVIEISTHGRDR